MQKEFFPIALASLMGKSGLVNGWESDIVRKLDDLSKTFEDIIAVAEKLSAGRLKPESSAAQLSSIFNSVTLDPQRPPAAEQRFYEPAALSLKDDVIFPKEHQGGSDRNAIDQIVNEIKQSLPKNYREDDENYLEEALSVLHRTTVNIPSAFSADVSFYDQQRMTAALAVCLFEKKTEEVKEYLVSFEKYKDEPVALLVGGDISGIQDFIYTITAKGAAKSLRGRSFYLQLLTEAILRFVLRELEIPYINVIYSGGGHFFLLAPVSKAEKIEDIQKKITQALLKHHGSSLYLALGYAEIPMGGFFDGKFPEYWGKMHGALARKKQKRYSELGADLREKVFKPNATGGNPNNTCVVCGEDHRDMTIWEELNAEIDDANKKKICSLCRSFVYDIGAKLPKSSFVALGFEKEEQSEQSKAEIKTEHIFDALAEFGMKVQFLESNSGKLAVTKDSIVLWALDDPKNGKWPASENSPKWIRYTANHVPHDEEGEIYPFDELQKKVEGGFERLGVLRMDVDSLGEIFKRGLGKQATLSRLASLSFRMSLFFEGWLKKLCEDEKYKGLIYTVYAGGDDVFLIGPWDLMPDLALKIQQDFAEYTSGNPDIHISAGMTFIDGKYPVYQAAEDAGDAIDDAKDENRGGKDAFTFLGKSWKWTTFGEIAKKQERLSALVKPQEKDKKAAPQALLQILQQLALEEEGHKKVKGLHVWGRWIWMGMYQLTRMAEQSKDMAKGIKSIRDNLKDNNYQEFGQWGVAARWTQLKERKKSKKEDAK